MTTTTTGVTPLEYVCFSGYKQDRRPKLAALLIAYGAKFLHLRNLRGHSLLQQEMNRNTKDYVILRAIVKTLVRLPSLQSLGVYVGTGSTAGSPGSAIMSYLFGGGGGIDRHGGADPEAATTLTDFVLKCNWYNSIANSPRTLQHHCRVAVREQLGALRLSRISSLPLPTALQDYLLLDYDEYR